MKIVAYGRYEHFNVCFGIVSMERGVYKGGEESEGWTVVAIYYFGVFDCLASELLKLEESTFV